MIKLIVKKRRTDKTIETKARPYKRRFDARLRHIKLILIEKQKVLPEPIWMQFLDEVRMSVIKHPQDYLGPNIPDKNITREAIHQVFDGFIKDMNIRALQSFRGRD